MTGRKVQELLACGLLVISLAGCSSTATVPAAPAMAGVSRIVCDSYIVLDMCVRDLSEDNTVDMIYFSDTREIFMYQDGRKELVAEVMPLHRCAVPLSPAMQATTDRILHRKNIGLTEEMDIARQLITSYIAAKPEIDACNARFAEESGEVAYEEEFLQEDFEWE